MNPFKTPTQMMYENAHLPHFSVGSKVVGDVVEQFAGRIQNAIRQYTKAAGKPPTAEEVKQLEDHIRGLSAPSAKPAATQARLGAQEPFANMLVDQSGRPYAPGMTPAGKMVTPERAKGFATREITGSTDKRLPSQFDTTPSTMKAREYAPPHVNAFPEDEFMSQANTGRTSNRTWNKSFTPSAEELAARQHTAEDLGAGIEDELGGLGHMKATEGDIPQMTSASEPFATAAGQVEGGALNRLTDEMIAGQHQNVIQKVIADFKARGIEPDQQDIINAVNAEINPMRHNYTGENPIGLRPSGREGIDAWRDQARASGLPETVVSKHPSDWKPQHQREYLLDTAPEQRGTFARDWGMEDLVDKRRRKQISTTGDVTSSPNTPSAQNINHATGGIIEAPVGQHTIMSHAKGGKISPRDMKARLMVSGYANRGQVKKPFAPEYGAGRAAAQGLSLGWSDELEAAARAAAGEGTYQENYDKLNASKKAYEEKYPNRAMAAELAGQVIPMAIPFVSGARAATAVPSLLSRLGSSVAGQGVIGGVQGAGSAEQGDRLSGAIINAATNAAMAPAMTAAGKAYGKAEEAIRRKFMNPEARQASEIIHQNPNITEKRYDYKGGMKTESSPEKQQWIGQTHAAGAKAFKENDPAYKAAVFNAWREANPEMVKATGAQNYDQLMKASYGQAAKETADQFKTIPNKVEFWDSPDYELKDYLFRAKQMGTTPAELMRQELSQGKPFQVFKDTDSSHPYLAKVDPLTGINENEKFRAVHDYYGHLGTEKPNQFGPKGEENAWMSHKQMYSPLAEPALTAETRGQNSWVNYVDPENVALRAQKKPTVNYAENKPVLLPPEASNPHYTGGLPSYLHGIVK